jgi:hypothetical protein
MTSPQQRYEPTTRDRLLIDARRANRPNPRTDRNRRHLLAWVLAILLGPLFACGAMLTLIVPGLASLLVVAGSLAGMLACIIAAVHLVDIDNNRTTAHRYPLPGQEPNPTPGAWPPAALRDHRPLVTTGSKSSAPIDVYEHGW